MPNYGGGIGTLTSLRCVFVRVDCSWSLVPGAQGSRRYKRACTVAGSPSEIAGLCCRTYRTSSTSSVVSHQERRPCNLRFPKKRPMNAPKTTVAMIAAPCAPSACHGVETGHAMRQPALIARPAPAPYRVPVTVGRVASEFRNIRLNSRTRIPPVTVLPIPQAKPMSHGLARRRWLTIGGTRRTGSLAGLFEKVSSVTHTTTKDAATTAE